MATIPFVQFSSLILYYIGLSNGQANLSRPKKPPQDQLRSVSSNVVFTDVQEERKERTALDISPFIHRHVAISTKEPFHGEVYDAFAWHIRRVSRKYPELNITVDIYEQEAVGDFTAWMQDLGMVTHPVKAAKDLRDDISRTDLFGDGRMIDLVIPASAETDVDEHSDYLWEAYQQRPADRRFELASIMHHGHNTEHWGHLSKWSRLRLFRYFFISEHVARKARSLLQSWADKKNTRDACFEYIRTDVFVPILDLSSIIIPKERDPPRGLSRVAIQGNFDQYMRDYEGTFRDLVQSFKADSTAWGYLPLRSDDAAASYQSDPRSAIPPFELHLLGGRGKLNIPNELKNVVKVHFNLESRKYWAVLQSMHVIVPAFSRGDEYYTCIASSSCHSAMQCNVPLLVTRRLRESYTYLEDSVTIVRPQAISEIQAIKVLRTGVMPEVDSPTLENDIRRMMVGGWRRSTSQFDAFKQKIWDKNDELVTRVLCGE
ncbi:hypothetical protein FRB94_006671 [Tulasnella sp. JGI-2019a]|nr:hypothetical protein FRB93_006429 [Tulasnella sp. JGI-2019a]KAG8998781.1 hypothetical protein FRB94_006671 [Tulasnella sp. JGI-2019a]